MLVAVKNPFELRGSLCLYLSKLDAPDKIGAM
jgi:hypothetical protein